jgi:hypothetical protein
MTYYLVIWKAATPAGPRTECTRFLTWASAVSFIDMAEGMGMTIANVVFE